MSSNNVIYSPNIFTIPSYELGRIWQVIFTLDPEVAVNTQIWLVQNQSETRSYSTSLLSKPDIVKNNIFISNIKQ